MAKELRQRETERPLVREEVRQSWYKNWGSPKIAPELRLV